MAKQEQFSGVWNGRKIRFKREWKGHMLTDEECEALCRGETIQIDGLTGYNSGKSYSALTRLEERTFVGKEGKEVTVVVPRMVDFAKQPPRERPQGVPEEYLGHKFTEDERLMLESGRPVLVEDYVSRKTGHKFRALTTYDPEENRLNFDFNISR